MMNRRRSTRRSRVGALLIVLGVVGATVALMPAASACSTGLSAQGVCNEAGQVVVQATATCSGSECDDGRIQYRVGAGSWTTAATGAFPLNAQFDWPDPSADSIQTRGGYREQHWYWFFGWRFYWGNWQDFGETTVNRPACTANLTVIKHVVTDNGGTAVASNWTMDIAAASPSQNHFPGSEAGTTVTINPGAFSVDESGGSSGYTKTVGAGCSGTAVAGGSYSCTITNDDQPATLRIIKHVVNHGGTAVAGNWTMDIAAASPSQNHFPGSEAGTSVTINVGPYSVDESGGPNTYVKTLSEGCAGTAVLGGSYSCTITNEEGQGRIIVRKAVSPADAPAQLFTFDSSWGPDFDLAAGGSHDSGTLSAGVHSVAEVLSAEQMAAGWLAGAAYCSDGSSPAAIGLSPGETVTCTFNNSFAGNEEERPTGSLTIYKTTVPGGGTGFSFDAGGLGAFTLDDGGSQVFSNLAAGEYVVWENAPVSPWELGDITCNAASVAIDLGARRVTVSLAEAENASCTFVNRAARVAGPEGSLTIVKRTVPAGGTGFSFDGGELGAFTLDDGGSQVFAELASGAYTVAEISSEDWEFAQVECNALDYTTDGPSVTVNLAEGEAAICTFTNGELPYTGPSPLTMPLLLGGLGAVLAGLALMVWPRLREVRPRA